MTIDEIREAVRRFVNPPSIGMHRQTLFLALWSHEPLELTNYLRDILREEDYYGGYRWSGRELVAMLAPLLE